MALVSAIITTYNRRSYLRGAVLSVLGQDYPDMEVIVIDDGSDDGSQEEVTDLPIRYVWKENGGNATIAFGEAWGTRFNLYKKGIVILRGFEASHAVNFAVTRDYGVVLIEPTSGKIWKATPGEDAIHFVKM